MAEATVAAPALARAAPHTRAVLALGTGAILLVATVAAGLALGSVAVAPDDIAGVLARRLLALPVPADWSATTETIVFELRLPRVLAAILVGAGLAVSGTVFQALLRNPLADPYVIGTAAGASLGAILGILLPVVLPALALGAGSMWLGIGVVQLLAFLGGVATVLVVYSVARTAGGTPVVSLLLTGYAVSSLLAAGIALLMFVSGRALGAIFTWLMGSLAGASWAQLALAAPLVTAAAVTLAFRWRRLNLLLLGEDHARHLGVDVEREKLTLTLLATLAASAVVAIAGTIGFVGLVVPHLLRLAIGPDHRLLLPATALYGAALLAAADLGARLAGGIPVGIVTALIGVPFFIVLLRRRPPSLTGAG